MSIILWPALFSLQPFVRLVDSLSPALVDVHTKTVVYVKWNNKRRARSFMMNGNRWRWCENYIGCCILWKLLNICIRCQRRFIRKKANHVQYAAMKTEFCVCRLAGWLSWKGIRKSVSEREVGTHCKYPYRKRFTCIRWKYPKQLNKLDNFHVRIDHHCILISCTGYW